MKILQVITSLQIGGAEKLVVDLVTLYVEKGHQVDVLLFNGVDTPFKKQLQDSGIRIIEFSQGGNVYNPLYIFRLIPIMKKYDVVHTHNTAPQLFAALANLFCRTKLITTEHSCNNRRRGNMLFRLLDKWMYRQYHSIVAISDKAEENLTAYLHSTDRVLTIYNGVNCTSFRDAQPDLQWRNGKKVITMVAGLRMEKDQDTLIRAMQYLSKDCYELWLVGDGVRRSGLEKLAEDCGVTDNVKFWGIRSDIPTILKTSDIVVMSSHWEGLSLSSIEGMSSGRPFLASDVDGLHEITDGYGILFPHGDDKAFAAEIEKLANDKGWYQLVAEKCQQRAAEFDIEKTVEQYLNVYKQL